MLRQQRLGRDSKDCHGDGAGCSKAAQAAAETAADNFDDAYLGAKSSDPTVDNDGDALTTEDCAPIREAIL